MLTQFSHLSDEDIIRFNTSKLSDTEKRAFVEELERRQQKKYEESREAINTTINRLKNQL